MLKSPSAPRVPWPSAQAARGALALCASFALVHATPAAAWTDASVRSVKAAVVVAPDGTAQVALRVAVRVHGGWLEGLELVGLDPLLTLDPALPAIVTGEDGAVYVPSVTVRPDETESTRVQLNFARHDAPRRGAYEVTLHYTTSLAHRATEASSDGETVRVHWTLPPWQSGLDGVELTLVLPGAARAVELDAESGTRAASVTIATVGERTQITWRRPHLPRTTVWEIAADVPAASLAPALRRIRTEAPGVVTRPAAVRVWPIALGLALLSLCIAFLTARGRTLALRRAGLTAQPIVPMPRALRVVAAAALVVAAPLSASAHLALAVVPLVGIAALFLVRANDAFTRRDQLLTERLATRADLRLATRAVWRARLFTLDALLDATTVPGALFAVVLLAAAVRAQALVPAGAAPLVALGAALALLPLFALTGRSRRLSPAAQVHVLRAHAAQLRLAEDLPVAMGMVVIGSGADLVGARIRLTLADAPAGLRALHIVLAERRYGSVTTTQPALRLVTRDGTDAARALAALDGDDAITRTTNQTTRLLSIDLLDDTLRALRVAALTAECLIDAALGDDHALEALLFDDATLGNVSEQPPMDARCETMAASGSAQQGELGAQRAQRRLPRRIS